MAWQRVATNGNRLPLSDLIVGGRRCHCCHVIREVATAETAVW